MTITAPARRLFNDMQRFRTEKKEMKRHIDQKARSLAAIDSFMPAGPLRLARKKDVRDHFDPMLRHDKKEVIAARHNAMDHLHAAELRMPLEKTNRIRKALDLDPLKHRPVDTRSVAGCARYLLKSKNVSFWSGLSTGSDRKNLVRLAHGLKAKVPATGGKVKPSLKMMRALVDMARHGRIQINALTGGSHSPNSNHYRGLAVDLDVNVGNPRRIERIANRHGGTRNFETSHIHLDF
jgi:hypothetical protein